MSGRLAARARDDLFSSSETRLIRTRQNGTRHARSFADTRPIAVVDLPTASRPIAIPVQERKGFAPGSPTRRPRTDTVPGVVP